LFSRRQYILPKCSSRSWPSCGILSNRTVYLDGNWFSVKCSSKVTQSSEITLLSCLSYTEKQRRTG